MKNYSYYPGCSLKSSGLAYDESLRAVFKALDAGLEELDDWNCCGATAYMSVDETEALAAGARNLGLAAKAGRDLVVPCNACYQGLLKAREGMREYPNIRRDIEAGLKKAGLEAGHAKVRHPMDVLINDIGLEAISARVVKPLRGLKVAPYYGCQIVRPYAPFDDQADPVSMDRILAAAGAQVVDYPLKTRCCGGSQTGTLPQIGIPLVHVLLKEARRRGADLIAVICPLCQFNLDCYQDRVAKMYEKAAIPVAYATQVLGLAFGLSLGELGIARGVVPMEPTLRQREISNA